MSAANTLAGNPSKVLPAANSRTLTTLLYVSSVDCECVEAISSGMAGGMVGELRDGFLYILHWLSPRI